MPTVTTIQCPRCNQTLPAWSTSCQFCGSPITQGYVLPVDPNQPSRISNRPRWQEVGYIVFSLALAAEGLYSLLQAAHVVPFTMAGGEAYFGITGAVDLGFGLGLLFQVAWVQWVMKLRCWLGLAWSAFGLLLSVGMNQYDHRHAVPAAVSNLVTMTILGFLLYFIHEVGDVD